MPMNPELCVPHSPFDQGTLRAAKGGIDAPRWKKVEPIAISVLAGGYALPAR